MTAEKKKHVLYFSELEPIFQQEDIWKTHLHSWEKPCNGFWLGFLQLVKIQNYKKSEFLITHDKTRS